MIRKRFNKRGQAAAELAIFGTLILLAFSVLLMYGQRLELQQKMKMEAFRKALQKAYEKNSSVSYTVKEDTRLFNLFGGYSQGQASTMGASASVMWQKGSPGEQGSDDQQNFAYYQINDEIIELPRYKKDSTGYDGGKQTVEVPVGVWKEQARRQESYTTLVKKQEESASIKNIRSSDLQDTVTTKLYVRFDKADDINPWDDLPPPPEYFYEGQTYYYEGSPKTITPIDAVSQGAYLQEDINRIGYSQDKLGEEIHRERNWTTPND